MTARKSVVLAFLVAAGILLQIVEGFVPVAWIIPGYKIGLANIAGLYALYTYGPKDMVLVTSLRIVLASLLTGTLFGIAFLLSVAGAVLSMTAMVVLKQSGLFSIYGVSVGGAAAHSTGQVLAITWIYKQWLMQLFLPLLLALSIVSGLVTAVLAKMLLDRVKAKRLHG